MSAPESQTSADEALSSLMGAAIGSPDSYRPADAYLHVPTLDDAPMDVRTGALPTMTHDQYPGLPAWWVQIWRGPDFDEILARVYGASPQEAMATAERVVRALARPAPAAGDALDALVNNLAGTAYQYAVTLDRATRDADSDELEGIARRTTGNLKDEIRAALAARVPQQGEA